MHISVQDLIVQINSKSGFRESFSIFYFSRVSPARLDAGEEAQVERAGDLDGF